MAVVDRHGVGFAGGLTGGEVLRRRVVQGVGPAHRAAGGVGRFAHRRQRKHAQRRLAGGRGKGGDMAVGQVDVGEADGAGGAERIGQGWRGIGIFDHRAALRGAGDADPVVGAGNLQTYSRPAQGPITESDCISESVNY